MIFICTPDFVFFNLFLLFFFNMRKQVGARRATRVAVARAAEPHCSSKPVENRTMYFLAHHSLSSPAQITARFRYTCSMSIECRRVFRALAHRPRAPPRASLEFAHAANRACLGAHSSRRQKCAPLVTNRLLSLLVAFNSRSPHCARTEWPEQQTM